MFESWFCCWPEAPTSETTNSTQPLLSCFRLNCSSAGAHLRPQIHLLRWEHPPGYPPSKTMLTGIPGVARNSLLFGCENGGIATQSRISLDWASIGWRLSEPWESKRSAWKLYIVKCLRGVNLGNFPDFAEFRNLATSRILSDFITISATLSKPGTRTNASTRPLKHWQERRSGQKKDSERKHIEQTIRNASDTMECLAGPWVLACSLDGPVGTKVDRLSSGVGSAAVWSPPSHECGATSLEL